MLFKSKSSRSTATTTTDNTTTQGPQKPLSDFTTAPSISKREAKKAEESRLGAYAQKQWDNANTRGYDPVYGFLPTIARKVKEWSA